jgi:large subunit ribosomal protein L24
MKSEFNKSWNKSCQPRKQRKFLINAPLHIRHKLLSAMLDKPLREKHKRKSIEIRKNDEVKVMRGKNTKRQGKILMVDVKNTRVQIDGINMKKRDGEKTPVWFHPSNLKIIKLDDSDKKRIKDKKVVKSEDKKTTTKETKKQENKHGEIKHAH